MKIYCFRWFINEIFEFRVSFYGLFSFILRNKFGRKRHCFISFRQKIIFTKLSKLLCHNIIQWLVVLGNVVNVAVVADCLEVAAGTFYLAFLIATEPIPLKVVAFWLRHKIDVLDTSFLTLTMGHPFKDVKNHQITDFQQSKILQSSNCQSQDTKHYTQHHRDIDTTTGRTILLYDTSVWHSLQFDLYV